MAKATAFNLLVLRAGRSSWDSDGRIVGDSDLPMCEEGRAEIVREIDELSGEGLSVILAAPDEASQQTAQLLRNGSGVKVRTLPGLAEMSMGLWEGVLGTDLEERFPKNYRQWLVDPSSVKAPEGEAFGDAQDRVLRTLARALEKVKGETPVIGVVARPLASGIIRCFVEDRPTGDLWERSKACVSRGEITREALMGVLESSGARA
ncbi:MAG: histidine phosphatase family protein [Phycisphaerales bacterium JB059]